MTDKFIVLCGQVVGGNDRPFIVEYGFDGQEFTDRKLAISHGFKIRESDDFNIGVIRDDKLVSLDWMEQTGDTDPKLMEEIQEQIWM